MYPLDTIQGANSLFWWEQWSKAAFKMKFTSLKHRISLHG